MKRVLNPLIAVIVLAFVAGAGWWYLNRSPSDWPHIDAGLKATLARLGVGDTTPSAGVAASGFIEADEVSVSTEVGGRVMALSVGDGDEVQRGQELVRLDDSLLQAQIEIAEADVAIAEARLAQLKAGVRRETLDYALALLEQAKTGQEAALVAWEDAQQMVVDPQELEIAIVAARARVAVAALQQRQALALANSAQTGREFAQEVVAALEDFEPFVVGEEPYRIKIKRPMDALPVARQRQAIATYQAWEAWTGYAQAQSAQASSEQYLVELLRQQANPRALEASAAAAEAQYQIASANVAVVQAGLDGLQIGATPEQQAVAEAQVAAATAAREALTAQAAKFTLQAPITGLVLELPVQVGELAQPGAALLVLADLDSLSLTVYVPEDRLGRIQVGQPVSVTVDAYPTRTFEGRVTSVAAEAEFTPQNIQSREERANMVFAVQVGLPNAAHALKPGMPAEAVLWPAAAGE